MPLQRCKREGKAGWKWGKSGTCYIGITAKQKAIQQALAITKGKLTDKNTLKNINNIRELEEITINKLQTIGNKEDIRANLIEKQYKYNQDNLQTVEAFKEILKNKIATSSLKRPKKPKKMVYPIAIEKQYARDIKNIMKRFTDITVSSIKPVLSELVKEQKASLDSIVKDAPADELERINEQYLEEQKLIFIDNRETLKAELFNTAIILGLFNKKQFDKFLKSTVGIEFQVIENWEDTLVRTWVNRNVNLIKGLTDDYIKKINESVLKGFQQGTTSQALAKDLSKINREFVTGRRVTKTVNGKTVTRTTQSRSELIARDQISKLNSSYTRKRQEDAGIDKYIWETARDERVRSKHKLMQGKLCRWDDPTVYSEDGGKTWISRSNIGAVQLHPGQDIQCRCNAIPYMQEIFNEALQEVA